LGFLSKLLSDDHFNGIRERLESKKMQKGITVLLYGPPGTGKTESVYQYARKTGRDIIQVDISSTKSKWFGDSEKRIKALFTQYKVYCEECERIPILLFNEADAIISKRADANASNVSKTENAIQNIIMEEMENFEGIFFATTNLANNMDSAFERRFLFKVKFSNPDSSVKAQIWQSKLPWLSFEDCEMLAKNYNFSGGQIDNIVRKSELYEVIHDKTVDITMITDFCENELLSKNNHKKIGF